MFGNQTPSIVVLVLWVGFLVCFFVFLPLGSLRLEIEIKFRHKKSQIYISCTPEFVASLCSHKILLDLVQRRCLLPEERLQGAFLVPVLFRSCRRQSFSHSGEEEAGELGLVDGGAGLLW